MFWMAVIEANKDSLQSKQLKRGQRLVFMRLNWAGWDDQSIQLDDSTFGQNISMA